VRREVTPRDAAARRWYPDDFDFNNGMAAESDFSRTREGDERV
jgi:hypothetical protein